MRMIKLLLAAAASVGRIDRPFLAPGIGRVGPIELDNYPIVHTKDILSHEAHRHPYIELLGMVYLMKLRFADDFGNYAGTVWRLLFVYALFPWLHQYRVKARPQLAQASRRRLSGLGRAATLRLEYLSRRNLVDSADYEGDDDDGAEDWEPVQSNAKSHKEDLVEKEQPEPETAPSPSDKVDNMVDVDRMFELEAEVARLTKELEKATQ